MTLNAPGTNSARLSGPFAILKPASSQHTASVFPSSAKSTLKSWSQVFADHGDQLTMDHVSFASGRHWTCTGTVPGEKRATSVRLDISKVENQPWMFNSSGVPVEGGTVLLHLDEKSPNLSQVSLEQSEDGIWSLSVDRYGGQHYLESRRARIMEENTDVDEPQSIASALAEPIQA